jgi:aspartate 1-decarboxylase
MGEYKNVLYSKISSVIVTGAKRDYEGTITLCPDLMRRAGLKHFDMVHVNCKNTGKHWETYVIPGKRNECCLNGAAANHFNIGDDVHILCYYLTDDTFHKTTII